MRDDVLISAFSVLLVDCLVGLVGIIFTWNSSAHSAGHGLIELASLSFHSTNIDSKFWDIQASVSIDGRFAWILLLYTLLLVPLLALPLLPCLATRVHHGYFLL